MMYKLFVRLIGVKYNGNNAAYDRWVWLKKYLPKTADPLTCLDVGCGNGWALFVAARKGYRPTGISNDAANTAKITQRATALGYDIDIQNLDCDDLTQLNRQFDVIINCENIEHIPHDKKLVGAMSDLLNDRGFIFFTTPNYFYKTADKNDAGPFDINRTDGGHVRRGYTFAWLEKEFLRNNLLIVERGYITNFCSLVVPYIDRKILRWLWTPLAKLFLVPAAIVANRLDRLFFKQWKHSLLWYIIAQKYND